MTDTLIVFRHAEKTGDWDDIHLSQAGRARAERLATFIPQTFGRPDRLFAAARSHHSDRCVETITPLAEAVRIAIDHDIDDHDIAALVDALGATGDGADSTTVVCWHHERIPALMKALGVPEGPCPTLWPDELFDLVLAARFEPGRAPTVETVHQPF